MPYLTRRRGGAVPTNLSIPEGIVKKRRNVFSGVNKVRNIVAETPVAEIPVAANSVAETPVAATPVAATPVVVDPIQPKKLTRQSGVRSVLGNTATEENNVEDTSDIDFFKIFMDLINNESIIKDILAKADKHAIEGQQEYNIDITSNLVPENIHITLKNIKQDSHRSEQNAYQI
jgi:hypothetical protein